MRFRFTLPHKCDLPRHGGRCEPSLGFGVFRFSGWSAGWLSGGLVVLGGVEGEVAEEFAGGGVDDADVQVVHEEDDGGSGVGSSDADVVEASVYAQGDGAAVVDGVASDSAVGIVEFSGGAGFGAGVVDDGGGGAPRE